MYRYCTYTYLCHFEVSCSDTLATAAKTTFFAKMAKIKMSPRAGISAV